MSAAPIELKIYNDQDEVVDTCSRTRIPSYLLDEAINLQEQLNAGEDGKLNTDAVFDFIVEFYNHKYDRAAIKRGTDLVECMSVLTNILARASALASEAAQGNPRVPSPKKK